MRHQRSLLAVPITYFLTFMIFSGVMLVMFKMNVVGNKEIYIM